MICKKYKTVIEIYKKNSLKKVFKINSLRIIQIPSRGFPAARTETRIRRRHRRRIKRCLRLEISAFSRSPVVLLFFHECLFPYDIHYFWWLIITIRK